VEFSRELRNDVPAGDITLSVRLWNGRGSNNAAATESALVYLIEFHAVTPGD
jgi:hypothetical protein